MNYKYIGELEQSIRNSFAQIIDEVTELQTYYKNENIEYSPEFFIRSQVKLLMDEIHKNMPEVTVDDTEEYFESSDDTEEDFQESDSED